MLSAPSELLLRNTQYFSTGKWLIINATDGDIFGHFEQEVTGLHQHYDNYLAIHPTSKGKHFYSAFDTFDHQFDGVIVYWPKSKQHGLMLCQFAATQLVNKGILLVVGDNKGGVKSAGKLLEKSGIKTQKQDSARHCTLLGGEIEEGQISFNIAPQINTYSLANGDHNLSLQTLPGAFSSDALDPGTELLLADLDSAITEPSTRRNAAKQTSRVLDFACGNGVIGLALAQRYPHLQVTMSDVSAIALHCAEQNIRLNQFDAERIKIVSSDGLKQVPDKFNLIMSNPPFHSATKTDYSISEQFFREAKRKLLPGGKLRIVANRFLKYPDQLESVFGNLKIITKNSKFSVYQCSIS